MYVRRKTVPQSRSSKMKKPFWYLEVRIVRRTIVFDQRR
jgi:hypothetical protein